MKMIRYCRFGFASDAVIPRSTYEELDVTKKQQALLQGIVVEDEKIPSVLADTKTETEFTDEDISYMITDMHNVELTDQGFTATEKKASVTLSFEGIPESETYFILKGLQFSEEGKTLTQSKSRLHIDVTCGKITKMITFLTRKNNFYSGVDDYLINAGYRDEKADEITLTFHEKGTYRFDEMQIVCQPVKTDCRLDEKSETGYFKRCCHGYKSHIRYPYGRSGKTALYDNSVQ